MKISVNYTGDLHCVAIHEQSGARITTDAPTDNQGKGEAFSPTDLVAAALGTCIATVIGIYAKRKNLNVEGMRVEVIKEMSAEGGRSIRSLRSDVWIPSIPEEAERLKMERIALTCPVHHSLHPDIDDTITFHWGK